MSDEQAVALKVSGLKRPVSLFVHGEKDQHVSKSLRETGEWEVFETALLMACFEHAQCFVDVGGNIGYYSLIAAAQNPALRIYAFEPDANNAAKFVQSIEHNGFTNISLLQAGLSDTTEKAQLFLSESNFGDHQIYDRGDEARQCVDIALLNGAEFLSPILSAKSLCLDVLKIDTQGAEYGVLKGLMQLLDESGGKLQCVIEYWPFGLRKCGSSGEAVFQLILGLMARHDLPLYIIDHIEHRLIPCAEEDLRPWVDALEAEPDNVGFMNLFLGHPPAGFK